jgi:hypothetical protein
MEITISIGKSVLVNDVVKIFSDADKKIFMGTGEQMKGNQPFHAFWLILETVVENGEISPAAKHAFRPDEQGIRNYKNSPMIHCALDLLPLLNDAIPSLKLPPTPRIQSMSPQMRAEATQMLVLQLLRYILTPGSLLVLEHGHWYFHMFYN